MSDRMRARRGQAVLVSLFTVTVITVLGGALLHHAMGAQRVVQTRQLYDEAFYLAEGGMEDAIGQFAQAIANFQISLTTPRYPAAGSLTTTFSSGAIASSVVDELSAGQGAIVDPDGISILVKMYRIRTIAQHPTAPGVSVAVNQIFTRRIISTFQHAVFYDPDLEWFPGATMTLTGRVHSSTPRTGRAAARSLPGRVYRQDADGGHQLPAGGRGLVPHAEE
jgi:hypothetical protein